MRIVLAVWRVPRSPSHRNIGVSFWAALRIQAERSSSLPSRLKIPRPTPSSRLHPTNRARTKYRSCCPVTIPCAYRLPDSRRSSAPPLRFPPTRPSLSISPWNWALPRNRVTVTAATPLLNTANSDLGVVLDKSYVGMVGVSLSRNVMNLRNLAPGVRAKRAPTRVAPNPISRSPAAARGSANMKSSSTEFLIRPPVERSVSFPLWIRWRKSKYTPPCSTPHTATRTPAP